MIISYEELNRAMIRFLPLPSEQLPYFIKKGRYMSFLEGIFLLINVVSILNVILVLKNLYGRDMYINWKLLWPVTVIYYGISLITVYFEIQGRISDKSVWVTIGFIGGLTLLFSKKHRLRNLLFVFPAIITYAQWTQIVTLFEHLVGLDRYYFYIQEDKITPLYFFGDISLLVILLYFEVKEIKERYNIRLTFLESVFVSIFCFFFFALVSILEMIEENMESRVFSVSWVVLVLAANVAVIYAIAHRKRASYYGKLSRNYRMQLNEEYEYFQEYKEKNKDIAKFRHDWKNHSMLLQELLREGKFEEASQYFEKLSDNKVKPVHKVITGNETVDMVLAIKQNILTRENIQVTYEGKPAELSFMDHVDICTIFSNLVDNAIESSRQVEADRYLNIRYTRNENLHLVIMKNCTKEKQSMGEGELPKTSKEDKKNHGFGMGNVMEIVKKYSGEMEVEQENYTFTVRLLFPRE